MSCEALLNGKGTSTFGDVFVVKFSVALLNCVASSFRFMRFMERYADDHQLGFTKKVSGICY